MSGSLELIMNSYNDNKHCNNSGDSNNSNIYNCDNN